MSSRDYQSFIAEKAITHPPSGFKVSDTDIHPMLFQWQRDLVRWAILRGKACLFEGCGCGKTLQQIEWARLVRKHTDGDILILAPLAVTHQTVDEAKKIGVEIRYCRSRKDVHPGITIANYEMLEHFDAESFIGVVLDESSIIKQMDGKTRNLIIQKFSKTPYKLACTATPAPNDHMELGNHSEFVGAMTRTEMLSMFFVHDGGETSKWRLKGHASSDFWKWICSWAVMLQKPSDLGYSDDGFVLPPLSIHQVTVDHDLASEDLFAREAQSLKDRQRARRESVEKRVLEAQDLITAHWEKIGRKDKWVVWCGLNDEQDSLEERLGDDCVSIFGSLSPEDKIKRYVEFEKGSAQVLITKASMFGFGVNMQFSANAVFLGLSDSWETYYQAVRRQWRFGQNQEVNVYVVTSTAEGAVVKNIERKERDAEKMAEEMIGHMHSINERDVRGTTRASVPYMEDVESGKGWEVRLGDCVEGARKMPDNSIDFSVFSPPFASLYTYSASDRDMGNSKDYSEFSRHFDFLAKELYRVIKPGRLLSFHCMNLPTSKARDGYIGIHDFRGELIRCFQREGFIFHSEVCIWKDPVTAMQRTKALGLLHKQLVKDSCMSRQGIPDYLVTMRKPGDNANPVEGELDRWIGDGSFRSDGRLSIDLWQRYASPVWMDINPSETLQKDSDRDEQDERHICPLQLQVIERAIELWSNPGDTVYSPFTGIGSEGYVALKSGREFIGDELKPSYWKQACANLQIASQHSETDLFASLG